MPNKKNDIPRYRGPAVLRKEIREAMNMNAEDTERGACRIKPISDEHLRLLKEMSGRVPMFMIARSLGYGSGMTHD